MGFGALIDNTIKGLTCLHEIINMYLDYEMFIKRDGSCVASKRDYPIGIMCM